MGGPGVVNQRPIAVFDFDGTLTKRDTYLLFLKSVVGWRGLARFVLRHPAVMLRVVAGDGDERDWAKYLATRELLAGQSDIHLREAVGALVNRILSEELREDVLLWLDWHRKEGHEVLIASASFEMYVRPVGDRLGADGVVATKWEVDHDGTLTGRLDGGNVRGQHKAVVVRQYLGPDRELSFAYGDSRGDRFLLALAVHPRSARHVLSGPPRGEPSHA
jgi:HAD superfamily hydrolase (TIGR01490 family)